MAARHVQQASAVERDALRAEGRRRVACRGVGRLAFRAHVLTGALACLAAAGGARAEPASATTASLAVEPIGFAVYPIPSRAVETTVFLTPADALSLNLARGDHEQLLTKYHSELLLARYRRQIGALLHVNVGFGYRTLRQTYETRIGDGTDVTVKTSLELLVGEVSFGNQVRFGPVVVGCDWLGLAVPLVKMAGGSSVPDGVDPAEKEDNEDAFDAIAFVPTLQLLRVSVGMAI